MAGQWIWDKEAMMELATTPLMFPKFEFKITFDNDDPRVELVERTGTSERVWSTVDLGDWYKGDIITVYLVAHVEAENRETSFGIDIKPKVQIEITKE